MKTIPTPITLDSTTDAYYARWWNWHDYLRTLGLTFVECIPYCDTYAEAIYQ